MNRKQLMGKLAKIISDNENYMAFRNQTLQITDVAYSEAEHPGYDPGLGGEALCDFKVVKSGKPLPFSLYEYEFELI